MGCGVDRWALAVAKGGTWGWDVEWDVDGLDGVGGRPGTAEETSCCVGGKCGGASESGGDIWEESGDGRGRYEGELFLDGMKYEFELDPRTGRIFDWTADLRD